MPIGIERINARRKQPNDRIIFIKPLEGPDKATAQDYLERIAAICNPIMKTNHLSVMSLEEYEPNPEFLGRNFNNGEVIQLVLKGRTGQWLPFRFVQMVMIHELAHNEQMNHSKAFWKVRDIFAGTLRELWGRGYTGEAMWSRGILLNSGRYASNSTSPDSAIPEHLCGGTYRSSRKRRRKAKENLSYKERQESRIAKKFGTNGMALGADDEVKVKLEKGKRPLGKPRVAGSARGRELRAAAALARFETKKEEPDTKEENAYEDESGSETASDDDESTIKTEPNEAVDLDGKKMFDSKGRGLIKVCEDEDADNDDARNELSELRGVDGNKHGSWPSHTTEFPIKLESWQAPTDLSPVIPSQSNTKRELSFSCTSKRVDKPHQGTILTSVATNDEDGAARSSEPKSVVPCSVCSMVNEPVAFTCAACAHVLHPDRSSSIWRCGSEVCKASGYINAGDCGVCGVCGARKSS